MIIDAKLKFTRTLTPRKSTTAIVLHHRAGEGNVESIHQQHLNQGWAGIGYNFYVRVDGSVYLGRGWDMIGAHAGSGNDYNSKSIGICFEGNFDTRKTMPELQLKTGVALIREALARYPGIVEIVGHRDISATACPGKYFPLEQIKREVEEAKTVSLDEFKRLYKAMIAEINGDNPSNYAEAKAACEKAKKAGLFQGDGKGNFEWLDPLTREELAIIFNRLEILDEMIAEKAL